MDTNTETRVITVEWDRMGDRKYRGIEDRVRNAFRGIEPVYGELSWRHVSAEVPVDRAAALLAALREIEGVIAIDEPYKEPASMRRVVDLLNAIADLREGDLLAVLELDGCTPLMDLGDDDTFKLDDDGRVVHIPGQSPPPKSLRHRVQTGQELANILLDHLSQVLGLGESVLPTLEKTPQQRSTDFGGRRFITCAARCGTRLA